MVMRAISLVSLASLVALGMGCSSKSSSGTTSVPADGIERLPDLKPVDPSANGFQLVMPIVRGIVPGASQEMCTWTDKVLDQDINVKSATGFQTKTGHHIVIYYTTKLQPVGLTRECKDEDMASFRIVIGTGGEGTAAALPADLATKIPAGAQIVVNHHYLNAGASALDAQSAVNIDMVPAGTKVTQSGNVAMLDTSLRIKPGPSGVDIHCKMQKDLRLWVMTPHMHAWGTHITVDHTKVADNSATRLVDVQWDPDFSFHPPQVQHDPAQPYILKAGDAMTVHCDYNNNTPTDLTFGTEMCVFFGQTVDLDGQGSIECDAGNWGGF
jgi:hypothetical protein